MYRNRSGARLRIEDSATALASALLLLFAAQPACAGGPRRVAGSSYFDASRQGQPIVWSGGQVVYYTDLGALSSTVTQAQANSMVAAAAAVWSSVSTAGVSIQRGGNLAEVVDQSISAGSGGVTLPADLQPDATGTPVAVIYDQSGSVIDALYGASASSPLACQNNGVIAAADNFSTSGNIVHALILVNGLCATTASQIATLQYQLVRAFGQVLGLDWSQANEEMFVGDQITGAGLQGWPIMHPIERLCNGSGGQCIPNPMQLRTDDIAALNRLYPVTASNVGSFPGKTITASATLSVRGTIQFATGQGMQGVNVVLQPVLNGIPDVRYTATAVSGVNFRGNAGNPVTGTADAQGNPLNRFGSDDPSLEGYFDLSGIPLPPGVSSAQYHLTFEPINPLYTGSSSVGPYVTGQVRPSGTMPVIELGTLKAGSNVTEIVLVADAADELVSGAGASESEPAGAPATGEWTGRITGYGHTAWFAFRARGSREFTVEAQPFDESGADTESKAQVVLGVWNGSDALGTLPVTGTVQPFNGSVPGMTTLPVLTIADSDVRIGVADLRGDGRPDYAYRGRILYADSVAPTRIPPAGGRIVIRGMGFRPSVTVAVNHVPAQVISVSPTAIVATAPPSAGVTGDVPLEVRDSQTLGVAAMAGALSYDAQDDDALSLLTAPMGAAPIGVPQPFTVRAIDPATQAPAAGIVVTFTVTEGTAVLGCGQISCGAITAGDGTATLSVTANSASLAQITASLSNGKQVLAEFTGSAPPSIAALTPNLYVALGATVHWPVEVMALSGGAPAAGQSITWSANMPGLAVAADQTASGADGVAANQIVAGPFTASISVTANACLAATTICAACTVTPVHAEAAVLTPWSGTVQYIPASQTFAPVTLRVTDPFGHPLAGASVTFSQTFTGWSEPCPAQGSCPAAPVLAQQTSQTISAIDGSVTLSPLSPQGQPGRLLITAITGGDTTLSFELDAHP